LVQSNGVPKRVELGKGTTKDTYPIEALDPPTHNYTVRMEASDTADLEVWLITWYGARLNVSSSTLNDPACRPATSQTTCEWRFPALEAQRSGIWELNLRKPTAAPVLLSVTVVFEAVD